MLAGKGLCRWVRNYPVRYMVNHYMETSEKKILFGFAYFKVKFELRLPLPEG